MRRVWEWLPQGFMGGANIFCGSGGLEEEGRACPWAGVGGVEGIPTVGTHGEEVKNNGCS